MDRAIQETEIMDAVVTHLREQLPRGWRCSALPERSGGSDWSPDAWLELGAGEVRCRLAVEVKARVRPNDLEAWVIRGQWGRGVGRSSEWPGGVSSARMFVTRFLTPRAREVLTQAGWNYADTTGNVRIAVERPLVFVLLQGLSRDPDPEDQPLRALRGRTASRVVRALLDLAPPYGVRELAGRARVSAAMVSRVVTLLANDAIATRSESGGVMGVEWRALLRRWSEDYAFARSNHVAAYLDLRGRSAVLQGLRQTNIRYAITGAFAAEQMRTVAASPRLALYTDQPAQLAEELGLVAQKSPATVLLAAPYDPVVFERTRMIEGLCFAAPSQVVVDLMTGSDREPQLAESVMQWMEENVNVWRA